MANLLLLCRYHHTFVHEHGLPIEADPIHRFRFVAADGRVHEACPSLPDLPGDALDLLIARRIDSPVELDELCLTTQGMGESVDYDDVIAALLQFRRPARPNVSAEP